MHDNTHLDTLNDLYLLFEDVCSHACDEYDVSAPMVYVAMKAFADSKQDDLKQLMDLL